MYAGYFNCYVCVHVCTCTYVGHTPSNIMANITINDDRFEIALSWQVCCISYIVFEENY